MIPLYIDIRDLIAEFNLSQSDAFRFIDSAVKDVAAAFYYEWGMKAKNSLSSTRNQYINSLQVVDDGLFKASVILRYDNKLVKMIEEGASPFDMKRGFKNSSKVKYSKDGGWYLTVPFRYAASTSLGEDEIFSGILPPSVYEVAVRKETDIPYYSGSRSSGLKTEELPAQHREPNVRAYIPETKTTPAFEAYKNKTAQFAGLIKVKDGTTGQTRGYMTFRRVSENSDKNSWIHKGLLKRDFAQQALESLDIEKIIDFSRDKFLKSL